MTREKAQELIQVLKQLLKTGIYELPKSGDMDKLVLKSLQSSNDQFSEKEQSIQRNTPCSCILRKRICFASMYMEQPITILMEALFHVLTFICG